MKHEISIPGHDLKIFTTNIEQSAINQIQRLLDIDVFADKKIRIMPDVHAGAGCVIGFTGDLGDKVIPNIVGVDIGCGMRVVRLGKIDNIDFHAFNNHILTHVPSGHWIREEKKGFKQLTGEEMEIYREAKELVGQLHCYRNLLHTQRIHKSIGSLGGGNHFIELNRDDEGWVYLVIHTGSRNLGKQVADHYQKLAIQHLTPGADSFEQEITDLIERYKAEGRRSEIQATITQMRKARAEALPSLPIYAILKAKDARCISTTCVCVSAGRCSTDGSLPCCCLNFSITLSQRRNLNRSTTTFPTPTSCAKEPSRPPRVNAASFRSTCATDR